MKMRVWAEYLSPAELSEKKVIGLLKRYGISIGIAFPQGSIGKDFAKMLKLYHEAGVEVALWPLMHDEQGYWVCERNATDFFDYVKRIYEWADSNDFSLPWLAVDLEIPHYQLEKIRADKSLFSQAVKLFGCWKENRNVGRFYEASRKFDALVEYLHARGVKTVAPVANLVAEDLITGGIAFQDMLETPVTSVNWDVVSVMMYTSLMVGYSKGLVTPAAAQWYLYSVMRDVKERLWDRAGVSIGVTYVGKLVDEPYYETPEQLLPDMRAVKAALIDDITIYNLEGILRYPQPEEWFETLINAEPEAPERAPGADVFRALCQGIARFA